jgi:hypothetical protein
MRCVQYTNVFFGSYGVYQPPADGNAICATVRMKCPLMVRGEGGLGQPEYTNNNNGTAMFSSTTGQVCGESDDRIVADAPQGPESHDRKVGRSIKILCCAPDLVTFENESADPT